MVSRQRLFHLITLLLVLMLALAACERPVPGSDTTGTGTTTDTSGAADSGSTTGTDTGEVEPGDTDVPTEIETDTSSGETEAVEEAAETPVPEEPTEESADDTTPRVEEEATAIPEEEATTSEESGGTDATPESDSSDKEDKADETATVEPEVTAEATAVATAEPEVVESVETETTAPTTHVVAPGENLYRIGLLYNVSWVTLAELNGLGNANRIVVGQELQIPGEPVASPEATPSPLTETTYTVQVNDNLFTIGLAYGISWVQIAEANGLVNPNQIIVGQVLKIPVDTPGPMPQFTHQVKAGETLFLIALRYGVAWPVIAEANRLSSPYVIYTGQTLVIPGGQ